MKWGFSNLNFYTFVITSLGNSEFLASYVFKIIEEWELKINYFKDFLDMFCLLPITISFFSLAGRPHIPYTNESEYKIRAAINLKQFPNFSICSR